MTNDRRHLGAKSNDIGMRIRGFVSILLREFRFVCEVRLQILKQIKSAIRPIRLLWHGSGVKGAIIPNGVKQAYTWNIGFRTI